MSAHDIIIKPLLSEKSYAGIKDKKYYFIVKKDANKTQIKLAIEEIFGVKVEKVNTMNCEGKNKRRGRTMGKTAETKKAIVELTKDSKDIEIFAGL